MKLAILGTGMIVNEGALPALQKVPDIEVVAIFARAASKKKAEELAFRYSIPKVFTDYEKLLQSNEIDFVYVGLVNSVHYEYGKKALLAGKNVIMEKPFASTLKEVKELSDIALQKGLYLLEAVSLKFLPNYDFLRQSLPKLGKIKAITANYSQYSSRYDKYLQSEIAPAFDPQKSGGALYDINIYNINFIVGLFGKPLEVSYTPNLGFNGIDTSGILLMKYSDFFATALGAKDSDSPSFVIIQGEKGWIKVLGAPNQLKSFEIKLNKTGKTILYELNSYEHRMVHEFEEFAKIYHNQDYERVKKELNISLSVMEVAEKARKQAGIVFGCD